MNPRSLLIMTCTLLVLVASCDQAPQRNHTQPDPIADDTSSTQPVSADFDRLFGEIQIREAKLFPQMMRADQLDAAARQQLLTECNQLIDDMSALRDAPWLSENERTRIAIETMNFSSMRGMYLGR